MICCTVKHVLKQNKIIFAVDVSFKKTKKKMYTQNSASVMFVLVLSSRYHVVPNN